MTEQRLGEVAARLEAERFVGRTALLALFDDLLSGASALRLLLLHGPGGVGKSSAVRAIERRATAARRPVLHLDGRVLAPTPEGLAAALAPATDLHEPVVLIDEADELAPLGIELRRAVLEALPASAVVVLAGRRAPGRVWFEGGLAALAASVAIRPLTNDESAELLARHDVRDPDQVRELVAWAKGYPLALTLAASLPSQGGEGQIPDTNLRGAEATLDDVLLDRLGGDELAGVDPDVLDVASIATAVDARLLSAVLPGRSTRDGLAQLRALSISEPIGSRTTLHRLARSALRARLRTTDPDRHRALVLRIAGHLRQRGLAESHLIGLELADLVEDPALRLGFDPSTTHYADLARPGDVDVVAEALGADGTEWFARFRRWCAEPRKAFAVRRSDGALSALSLISMASDVPAWAWDDIETGPVLRHAAASGTLEQAALMHDATFLETDPAAIAEAVRVGNAGTMNLGAIRNPRYIYVTASYRHEDGTEPLGYRDVPELRRADHERELVTMMTDFGPDGFVGQLYGLILAEQQVEPPAASGSGALALVEALRSFHDDGALAANPVAEGLGAEHARAAVRTAIDEAFGPSATDQLLRRALERTYLDPDGGHGIAQRELHMSRSSFYRHLQRARQQLVGDARS